MGKIKEVQFTIPVTGLQYTDVRPVISGEDWDDIKTTALKVAESVGNEKLVDRLSGAEKRNTEQSTGLIREIGDGVLFNETEHTYSKDGKEYLSGSTFAHMFAKEFPKESVAQKVADKEGTDVTNILDSWVMKGEISLQYGTLIHKCIEAYLTFGIMAAPSNEYLQAIVEDFGEVFEDLFGKGGQPEAFLQDDVHQLCGFADYIDNDGNIYDWKTGDIHKKQQHTLGKEFPNDALSLYTLQLNFYRYIMEQNGRKVNKLFIGWLNGEHWEKVPVPVIDIRPYLEQVWKPKK